ncbi:MAG: hypothetical protein U9O89_07125 [Thermoproteota archaeon]|nr:hypothetical protein [Thermoproteota archaeon]
MMRTVEILFVIIIVLAASIASTQFAVLPSPRLMFNPNLQALAETTLQVLDTNGELTRTVFSDPDDSSWWELQVALSACLPPNVVYNFTVYNVVSQGGVTTYQKVRSFSDAGGDLGVSSKSASSLVASPNVTYTITPQKIGEGEGKNRTLTLYILNCEDANGWWITGYTAQTLAADLYNLLSPYFETTIMVSNTTQLGLLLNGTRISKNPKENVTDAVIINGFGECVPIPSEYCQRHQRENEGYYSPRDSYSKYCHTLGIRTRQFNWTWVSIVGYPLYYVSNTATFKNEQNSWGIYGMRHVGPAGLNAFLRGLDNQTYDGGVWRWDDEEGWVYGDGWITKSPGVVEFSLEAYYRSNYYGLYPAPYQTATRALPSSIEDDYNLTIQAVVFKPKEDSIATATFRHAGGGALTAIGLTRIPDIRVTALALLMYYHPQLYKSHFEATKTSRLVVLQLAKQGGD